MGPNEDAAKQCFREMHEAGRMPPTCRALDAGLGVAHDKGLAVFERHCGQPQSG